MANIIVPERLETAGVRRGRAMSVRLLDELRELRDRGKVPSRVVISTAAADDLRAYLDFASASFDGVLPRLLAGVPVVVEPGVAFGMAVDFERRPAALDG